MLVSILAFKHFTSTFPINYTETETCNLQRICQCIPSTKATIICILLGLDEYTTYSVSVAANNSLGIGPYSQPVQVKTLESSKSILVLFFVDLIGCTTCHIV